MNSRLKLLYWVCQALVKYTHRHLQIKDVKFIANKFDNRIIMQIKELSLEKLWDKSIYSSGEILELYQVHRNFESEFYIDD